MNSTNNKILEMTKDIVVAMLPNNLNYLPGKDEALQIADVIETIYKKSFRIV